MPRRFGDLHSEQLWTRHDKATDLYEICCIPFFIYDLALGDLVSIRVDDQAGHVLDQVVTPTDHFTFRIYFGDVDANTQLAVLKDLSNAPVQIERYSANLIAVHIQANPSPNASPTT